MKFHAGFSGVSLCGRSVKCLGPEAWKSAPAERKCSRCAAAIEATRKILAAE